MIALEQNPAYELVVFPPVQAGGFFIRRFQMEDYFIGIPLILSSSDYVF